MARCDEVSRAIDRIWPKARVSSMKMYMQSFKSIWHLGETHKIPFLSECSTLNLQYILLPPVRNLD